MQKVSWHYFHLLCLGSKVPRLDEKQKGGHWEWLGKEERLQREEDGRTEGRWVLRWSEQGRGDRVWSEQTRWQKPSQSLECVAQWSCPTMPFPARKCLQELLRNWFNPFHPSAQAEEDNPPLLSVTVPTWCAQPKSTVFLITMGCLNRYYLIDFFFSQDFFLKQCRNTVSDSGNASTQKLRKATFQV